MDPNFVFPAVFKNQTGSFYSIPEGSVGLFASGNQFYFKNNLNEVSGLIDSSQTGGFASSADTGNFVTTSQTGQFVTGLVVRPSETGAFLTTGAADSRYTLQSATGAFVTTGQTGQFVTGSVVRPSQTGAFLTTGAADGRYALQSATGSFITTSQTGAFVATTQTGAFLTTGAADSRYALQSATGNFITSSQTGAFAAAANTGAFLTTGAADNRYYTILNGQSISGFATTGFNDAITGISVTGSTTKTITLFQRDGTTVTGNFTDIDGTAFGVIVFAANGGGLPISTGYKSFTTMTYGGEILEYTLLADKTGNIVIDIWKDSYSNYPPTSGDSICASSKPTLATGIKNTDSTLTSWTKTFSAGDVFAFNIDSVSSITNVNLTLKVQKT